MQSNELKRCTELMTYPFKNLIDSLPSFIVGTEILIESFDENDEHMPLIKEAHETAKKVHELLLEMKKVSIYYAERLAYKDAMKCSDGE